MKMGTLQELPNIGPEMERQLNAVGIHSPEELRKEGARKVWLKIRAMDSSACYNRLCGLEGAVQGIRWHNLPGEEKASLKEFYTNNK